MEQRHCNAYVRRGGGRRPFVLVEDEHLDLTTLDLCPPGSSAFDIVVCTGPGEGEECPLVMDGSCPSGRPDVVVHAFDADHPWSRSVRAAWAEAGVPVATADEPLTWPAHVGAAVRVVLRIDGATRP